MDCSKSWMSWGQQVPEYPAHMEHFGLLLKSFLGDIEEARRLVDSYRRFAPDNIPLTAVVPEADIPLFKDFSGSDISLIADEELQKHLVTEPVAGLRPGYVNQEIIKLAFHELGVYENYFTVDSELEFLRPISRQDFLAPDGVPYSVLMEDRDLAVDPDYFRSYWGSREAAHRAIWDLIDVPDPVVRTCHGHTTFSTQVLASFVTDFLEPRDWTYKDAIAFSPYEYTWYNAWLLKSEVIPVHPRESLVKVFHTEEQLINDAARGIDRDAIARGYIAVVINGNFDQSRSVNHAGGRLAALPLYMSTRELLALLRVRVGMDLGEKFSFRRR